MKRRFATTFLILLAVSALIACAKKTPQEKLQEAARSLEQDPFAAVVLAHEILSDPNNTTGPIAIETRQLLVRAYLMDRNFKEARKALDDIIKQKGLNDPEGQDAARLRIQTYEMAGQPPVAFEQVTAFLEGVTTGTTFWAELMLRRGHYLLAEDQPTTARQFAIEGAKQVLENRSFPPEGRGAYIDAMNQLVKAYGTTETAKTGVEYLQSYVADEPTTEILPNVHMRIGHLAEIAEEKEVAEKHYQAAFDIYDKRYEEASGADEKMNVLISHAQARSFRGETTKSVELLQKGIKEFPADPERINLYYQIVQIYGSAGQFDKGVEAARQIQTEFMSDPERVNAYFFAADMLAQQKKYDEAAEELKQVMSLFPGSQHARGAQQFIARIERARVADSRTTGTATLGATTPTLSTAPTSSDAPTTPTASAPSAEAAKEPTTTATHENEPSSPTGPARQPE